MHLCPRAILQYQKKYVMTHFLTVGHLNEQSSVGVHPLSSLAPSLTEPSEVQDTTECIYFQKG